MTAAIWVEGLSKRYRVRQGQERTSYRTLRESLSSLVTSPFRGRVGQGDRDQFWALKDVSFEVQPGEVVGIIGRNGAGKSTLLKILSRITKPTKGQVHLNGRVGSLLEVGTGFHPELTGRENIYLNGSILGMSRKEIDRRFDEIVAFAEVEKFLDTPVKRYSSGMYVRLAFAVAAHLEPEILIVDEVLAVGDAAFQQKCLNAMRFVAQEGRTVILVSHQMDAVDRLCARVIRLDKGRVVNIGKTKEIIATYLGDVSQKIIPSRSMDLREKARQGNGQAVFTRMKCFGGLADSWPNTGGPLHIELEIDAKQDLVADSIAVTLYDRSGFKLVNADTVALNRPISLRQGTNRLGVCIHQIYLKPGQYVVGLWLARRPGTVFDFLEAVGELQLLTDPNAELCPRAGGDGVVKCQFDVKVL